MPREARIIVAGVELSQAQSMAVRVAVTSMLTELAKPKSRRELGKIAEGYQKRLGEVQTLIIADTGS